MKSCKMYNTPSYHTRRAAQLCSPRYRIPYGPLVRTNRGRPIDIIIREVALFFEISEDNLRKRGIGKLKGDNKLHKRITIYLLRNLSKIGWDDITDNLGGMDRSTAIYHYNCIADIISVYDKERAVVQYLERVIKPIL